MKDAAPILEARELSVSYGSDPVLRDFNLVVQRGELLGIRGPNGCGKSTLLKAILGVQPIREGSLNPVPAKLRAGYVPQHTPIERTFPITVSEYLALNSRKGRFWLGGIPASLRQGVCGKLDCLGISHLARRALGTLSGGELQRVRIAAALLEDPVILLLDEPSSHLDPDASQSLKALLRHLHREHALTLLIVSHSASFLDGLATRQIHLPRPAACTS